MKIGQTITGAKASYKLTSSHAETAFLNTFSATVEGGNGESVLVYLLPPGVRPEDRKRYQDLIQSFDSLSSHLESTAPSLNVFNVLETAQKPIPFIAAVPLGHPLPEQIVANGSLSELAGLKLAYELLTVLWILHDDFDMGLSSTVFDHLHWDSGADSAWLPVWLGLNPEVGIANKGWDMILVGESLHLALLGQEPLRLWGYPVALPDQHEVWTYLSYGLQRLLCDLLHPSSSNRPQSTEALTVVERMINVWEHAQPTQLLSEIEDLLERGRKGEQERVEEAQSMIDILKRRNVALDWTFDALVEETDDLLQHRKAVSGAINLARGGSIDAALAQLAQAASADGSNLDLWRWHTVLAEENGADMLRDAETTAQLEGLLSELARNDIERAGAKLAAFNQIPSPIEQEMALRTAWREFVETGDDSAAALARLDAVNHILASIADEGFRRAWDAELGGLSEWRQRAAVFDRQNELVEEMSQRVAAIVTGREAGDFADAVTRFELAILSHPYEISIHDEACTLGLSCLRANQPFLARQVYSRTLSVRSGRRTELLLGWRTAQAISLLKLSPHLDITLYACQRAVADLLSAQQEERERAFTVQLAVVLETAIIDGLGRVRANESSASAHALTVLTNEWQRLSASRPDAPTIDDNMIALESALQRAWASDSIVTKAQLSKWLEQLELDWPQRESISVGEIPDSDFRQDVDTARRIFGGMLSKARQGLTERYGIGDIPESQVMNEVELFRTANEIAEGLLSPHFDEAEAALQALTQWKGEGPERSRLGGIAQSTIAALAQHRSAMVQVVALAESGKREEARRKLLEGTRNGESRTAWDPHASEWVSTEEWLALLQSSDEIEEISSGLMSDDPLQWARTLQAIKTSDTNWPNAVQEQVQQRRLDLSQHWKEMETVFSELKVDPSHAFLMFDATIPDSESLHCWNPVERSWTPCSEVRAILLSASQAVIDSEESSR